MKREIYQLGIVLGLAALGLFYAASAQYKICNYGNETIAGKINWLSSSNAFKLKPGEQFVAPGDQFFAPVSLTYGSKTYKLGDFQEDGKTRFSGPWQSCLEQGFTAYLFKSKKNNEWRVAFFPGNQEC
jgi:hypothetical protein